MNTFTVIRLENAQKIYELYIYKIYIVKVFASRSVSRNA